MQPSPWLYDFLRQWEKLRLHAYLPTLKDKWTIGYGHTEGVREGDVCTPEQAATWLHDDVNWAVAAVSEHVRVTLSQPQFDALVSLCFNIGEEAFATSTLVELLNGGANKALVAGQFGRWNKQRGAVVIGLTKRRQAEKERFLS